jgi:hypothetical protein
MQDTPEVPLLPELEELPIEDDRLELLAEELREAIRRKLAPVEAPA